MLENHRLSNTCPEVYGNKKQVDNFFATVQKFRICSFLFFLFFWDFGFLVSQELPPRLIPSHLYNEYTLNGTIPVMHWYKNDSYSSDKPRVYTMEQIQKYINQAKRRVLGYYGNMDSFLYAALDAYAACIKDKEVAILGSVNPWYEGIILAYEGHPTTIEYNALKSEDPRLKVMTVKEYQAAPKTFDVLLSLSSFEHDGLGRYGDPINPNGDLEAMARCKGMLKPDGILILSVPVGRDCLVWNAHRIYGPIRLPLLLKGWDIVASFGFSSSDFQRPKGKARHQPVFVLKAV